MCLPLLYVPMNFKNEASQSFISHSSPQKIIIHPFPLLPWRKRIREALPMIRTKRWKLFRFGEIVVWVMLYPTFFIRDVGTNDFHWGEFLHSFDLKNMKSYFSSQKNAKIFKTFLKFWRKFLNRIFDRILFFGRKKFTKWWNFAPENKNTGSHDMDKISAICDYLFWHLLFS